MYKGFIKFLCVVGCLFAFAVTSPGDVGNFNDYDSGSSWSDSSSSGWSSDSSDWDSDYSRSSRRSSSDEEHQELSLKDLIIFAIAFAVFLCVLSMRRDKTSVRSKDELERWEDSPVRRISGKWPDIPNKTREITAALQEEDPAFNEVAFLEWVKEMFFQLQEAWMARDWEPMRPFESEELFAQHERQLQEYKRLGRINMLERINVNHAYFFSLVKDPEWDTLSVVLHVRMIDYIIDEHSRQVLKGSPDQDCFLSYFYVFKRKAGVKTPAPKQGVDTIACPNCGAPTHVVSSGKCEYCNFVITIKDHGWVLSDMIGLKPPYNCGPGGVFVKNNKSEE